MKIMGYIMLVIALSVFALPVMAASSVGTVTRSFSGITFAPDATVTIKIIPTNLPSGPFYTYETIPAGFTFVSTTAFGSSNVGNVYTLKQTGSTAFTYTIKAPAANGIYTFSGTFKNIDLDTGYVGGANQITVFGVTPKPTYGVIKRLDYLSRLNQFFESIFISISRFF